MESTLSLLHTLFLIKLYLQFYHPSIISSLFYTNCKLRFFKSYYSFSIYWLGFCYKEEFSLLHLLIYYQYGYRYLFYSWVIIYYYPYIF